MAGIYTLPDCAECGAPVSLTDKIGHAPDAVHRWCSELRWERHLADLELKRNGPYGGAQRTLAEALAERTER